MQLILYTALMHSLRLLGALALAMAGVMLPMDVQAAANQVECESISTRVKAIRLVGSRDATVNFTGGGGRPAGSFDPVPLLSTKVDVTRPTCLVAHFSAMAHPADNHMVFQVRVDGIPMQGHDLDLFGTGTAAVSDPNQTDVYYDVPRMVAYSFFQRVGAGIHTVEVLFAGCCSALTGIGDGLVSAAVLTLEY
jgi:hypothetical protein